MTPNVTSLLREAVVDVLERFAFLFAEPDNPHDIPPSGDTFLHATITYAGDRSGSLSMTAPATLCRRLAANVLGLDEDAPEARDSAEDAIKELVNICCGEFAYSVYGDKVVLDLTPPRATRVDGGKWRELMNQPDKVIFSVDDQPLLVTVDMED